MDSTKFCEHQLGHNETKNERRLTSAMNYGEPCKYKVIRLYGTARILRLIEAVTV